jgi:hypothetical protein
LDLKDQLEVLVLLERPDPKAPLVLKVQLVLKEPLVFKDQQDKEELLEPKEVQA